MIFNAHIHFLFFSKYKKRYLLERKKRKNSTGRSICRQEKKTKTSYISIGLSLLFLLMCILCCSSLELVFFSFFCCVFFFFFFFFFFGWGALYCCELSLEPALTFLERAGFDPRTHISICLLNSKAKF